jgi:hypothetical protein
LLADHEQNGNDSSLSISRNSNKFFPEGGGRGVASEPLLSFELGRHLLDLGLDIFMGFRKPIAQ